MVVISFVSSALLSCVFRRGLLIVDLVIYVLDNMPSTYVPIFSHVDLGCFSSLPPTERHSFS